MPSGPASPSAELIRLGRAMGESSWDLVIAGEGNISGPADGGIRVVTASGARLGELDVRDLVAVNPVPLCDAIDEAVSDAAWLELILGSRVRPDDARPTVEVALHAVIAQLAGPVWILHAHPVDVLAIACSDHLSDFANTRLFPDHVVALGVADLWLPYVDPGRPLAIAVRDGMLAFQRERGALPVSILLANHGAFVFGSSPSEALDRLLMLTKAARIFTRGGRRAMPWPEIERIRDREDEAYRRAALRGAQPSTG